MKGYFLTLEAFLSLLVVILLISSLPMLLVKQKSDFDSFVFLTDSFEVMEKKYHGSLATWMDYRVADPSFKSYFDFIQNNTGKSIQLRYDGRVFPSYDCIPELNMKRLVVTSTGPHNTLIISLCK